MDLRLVTPALVVWATTLLGLLGPAWSMPWLAMLSVIAGAALSFACWRRHDGWGAINWRSVGVVVVGAGMAATCAAALWLRLETRAAHPLFGLSGKTTVSMTIRDDPRNFGPAARGQVSIRVAVDVVGGKRVRAGVADLVGRSAHWAGILPGQRVIALVSVRAPRGGDLSVARLAAVGSPRLLGRPPPIQRAAGAVRERLQQSAARALHGESAGLLPGLVIGDESTLSTQVRAEFVASGLSHLTAVSGANFALICGAAVALVRVLGASPRVAAACGAVVIVAFVVLVRPSPSVLRAAMMGGVGLLALISARQARALPALGIAVVGGLLWWPELALAPGFALSVAATAGLVVMAPRLRDWLREKRVPSGLAEVLAIAIAAQIVTAPLIALISGTFNVVSVLANVLVAPVVAIISVVGTVAAIVGAFGPPGGVGVLLAELLLRALRPELWWMLTCAHHLGGPGWAAIAVPSGVPGLLLVVGMTTLIALIALRWRNVGAPLRAVLTRIRR
ncbi:MAG: ComEC/Rec2 family competence protein [Gordonia sp. (in: high G+C Gram-positive bacteria)]